LAIAKDDASRTRYIKYQIDNYYDPIGVIVRRGVYNRNSHLDPKKVGILCLEHYTRLRGAADAVDLFRCMLRGGEYKNGVCVGA
jgi:hypothetical protein